MKLIERRRKLVAQQLRGSETNFRMVMQDFQEILPSNDPCSNGHDGQSSRLIRRAVERSTDAEKLSRASDAQCHGVSANTGKQEPYLPLAHQEDSTRNSTLKKECAALRVRLVKQHGFESVQHFRWEALKELFACQRAPSALRRLHFQFSFLNRFCGPVRRESLPQPPPIVGAALSPRVSQNTKRRAVLTTPALRPLHDLHLDAQGLGRGGLWQDKL